MNKIEKQEESQEIPQDELINFVVAAFKDDSWKDRSALERMKKWGVLDNNQFLKSIQKVFQENSDKMAYVWRAEEWGLFDNKDFVLSLVKRDHRYLEHASNRLKNDREIVMSALKSGYAYAALDIYEHISKSLQKDPEIKNIFLAQSIERDRAREQNALHPINRGRRPWK
jgi:Domain of unknown function (DUF4116)